MSPAGRGRPAARAGARALQHLPTTAERFADGDISEVHARALARRHGNERVREALERDEAMLSGEAAKLSFWLFQNPVSGAEFDAAVGKIDDELRLADRKEAEERLGREPICGDLRRSPAQRRADALTELARRGAASPPGARRPAPLVSVLVGYETFAGRVCELADGTVLAPSDVAALLDEAVIERAVFDGPARVLEVGEQRFFRGALRRAMELRDRICWHPFCEEPAERCDGDHAVLYADGGPTELSNSRPGCPFHNRIEPQRRKPRRRRSEPDSDP